ncbi:hypothetical protein BDW69DRAFT_39432 [Aspergillus filifer]
MASFENSLYSLPTSPFPETLWTSWNSDASPTSSDDGSLKMESSWQAPVYSFPDYYCFLDKWSDQSSPAALTSYVPAGNAVPMDQFSDNPIDMSNCASSLDTFAAPIFSGPIASASAHDLTTASTTFHDYSSNASGATTPSDHSSPSASDSSTVASLPTPPVQSHTRPTRDTKTPIRCWEHSCGGRAFSSLGNYERHLREKSGRAKSFSCEQCGQRFTRSTAKNKHIRYGRCRARHPR